MTHFTEEQKNFIRLAAYPLGGSFEEHDDEFADWNGVYEFAAAILGSSLGGLCVPLVAERTEEERRAEKTLKCSTWGKAVKEEFEVADGWVRTETTWGGGSNRGNEHGGKVMETPSNPYPYFLDWDTAVKKANELGENCRGITKTIKGYSLRIHGTPTSQKTESKQRKMDGLACWEKIFNDDFIPSLKYGVSTNRQGVSENWDNHKKIEFGIWEDLGKPAEGVCWSCGEGEYSGNNEGKHIGGHEWAIYDTHTRCPRANKIYINKKDVEQQQARGLKKGEKKIIPQYEYRCEKVVVVKPKITIKRKLKKKKAVVVEEEESE